MLKLVVNCGEEWTPNAITAASAKTRPTSQRTSERTRSRAKVGPPLAQGRGQPERDSPVERDRAEQERARDRLVPERRDAEHVQRRQNRVQEQRAEGRADDAPAPAEDCDAAHDDRGDHLELVAAARRRRRARRSPE